MKIIKLSLVLVLFFHCFTYSQSNSQWNGYFSYNGIKDITQSSSSFFAATENAIFSKNTTTNDISTINSIDGLKADLITSIYRSEAFNVTLVGNSNGLLSIINSDGTVIPKRGIIDEVPVSPLIKKINNFYEHDSKVYISCDYGISVFDLNTLEFGDTYYIGNSGQTVKVYQTTVFNNEIYAVTEIYGMRKAVVTNPNLVDFSQWSLFDSGQWNGIATINNQLVASNINSVAYKYNGTNFIELLNLNQPSLDFRENENYLIITTQNHVYIFNQDLVQIADIQTSQITEIAVTFTCATIVNDIVYIGTNENGVVSTSLSSPTTFQFIMPDGPLENNIFRLKKSTSTLWALYGKYSRTYNPYFPSPAQKPISKFTSENGWDFIPYSELFGAKALSNIALHPNNDEELYVSSFFSGVLKIVDGVPIQLFDQSNTGSNGLESLSTAFIDVRINGVAFDKNKNLWMTNTRVNKGLKVLKSDGNWQSYDFSEVIPEPHFASYGLTAIDKNNTKWIPSIRNGLIAFNETLGNKSIVIETETNGNLPDIDVRCVAIDNRNQLWIGTARGLRIISSVDQFLSQDAITTRDIIIEEDGLAQELFFQQFIVDIAIDGANRKWVSLADAGVYLVSPNGQETIYQFTKDNSPLPSNNINDIEIDGVTGEVFFATDKGLVSFKGTSTKPQDDLSNVYVYPNPVRPEFSGTIKIAGLTDKAIVKIADIEGNLVFETTSSGGTIEWDGTAFGKYKVASGVYMIFVSAEDGIETTVKKVMIIR
ncbi:two-component regulator propeller domain-containing protein [Flavobacterium sp.]|uniref:type IX secretion system anionic LPS delivery protein PorZ n=1 Tax=Flavobacterium sp. TaxID=239 RepID=UPI0026197E7F|nr:two-component regulator propeller domain-containing protein [Flavobacterium sp.]